MPDSSYPPKDSFHWKDNIFFAVNPNYGGMVECFRHDGQYHLLWAMSLQSWDSIVGFVASKRDNEQGDGLREAAFREAAAWLRQNFTGIGSTNIVSATNAMLVENGFDEELSDALAAQEGNSR